MVKVLFISHLKISHVIYYSALFYSHIVNQIEYLEVGRWLWVTTAAGGLLEKVETYLKNGPKGAVEERRRATTIHNA